jgi:dihydroorotate dehydrogenase
MHYYPYLTPLIFRLPPETAHRMAIGALRHGLVPSQRAIDHPALRMDLGGVQLRNPVGLAAGFDKNAEAVGALCDQGFGFVECGTVTLRPQDGNPHPRLFRLQEDEALINRLGFNNMGVDACKRHLAMQQRQIEQARLSGARIGINIGKNKTSEDAIGDYTAMFEAVHELADYVTVNISSPNTPGLRDLQGAEALDGLLAALCKHRRKLKSKVPLWFKLAPDMTEEQCREAAEVIAGHPVDALVISNTTLDRPASLRSPHKGEEGGLSGKPLLVPSTARLRLFFQLLGSKMPLVGVGGISSAADAYGKIRAGASAVQLYTALAYQGFGLVRDINAELLDLIRQDGFSHLREAVGVHA